MPLPSGESERILCAFNDGLRCEPERLCDISRVSRHAETIDPEGNALIADPTGPAESCGGFMALMRCSLAAISSVLLDLDRT